MSDEKTPTPIPIHIKSSHERRLQELERERGVIARDQSKVWDMVHSLIHRMGEAEKKLVLLLNRGPEAGPKKGEDDGEDRPSQVDLSIHPNRIRASFKNQPFLSLLTTLLILSLTAIAIIWLLKTKR